MPSEYSPFERAADLALQAGERELIRYFHPEALAKSQFKDHKEYVTAADHAANRAIQSVLHRLTPDIPVVSEEGSVYKFQNPKSKDQSNLTWLLDPLDGTTNFVIGLPLWGISLALLEDGVPVRGWLTMPKLGERYVARLNQGAWRNGKKFHLNKKLTLQNGVGLFCHGYREEEKAADMGVLGPKGELNWNGILRNIREIKDLLTIVLPEAGIIPDFSTLYA